jgi:ubiquinone/menaquinone biosynthesis C-methylase UbiE
MNARQFASGEPELMDRPDASPAELEQALTNLQVLNRWFGSYRIVDRFARRWIKRGDRLRVVDLATGAADIPRRLVDHARRVGAQLDVVAVDFQPSTIAIARQRSSAYPEINCTCADVLTFDDAERFDIVICSLALHHFSDDDAVQLLRRCRELSRARVLVSDLRRGWLATAGVFLLTSLICRDRMTREDGRVSAARSFTLRELRQLAERAGWRNVGAAEFAFARQAIWIE